MIYKLVFGLLVGTAAPHVVAQAVTDIQAPPSNAYNQTSNGTVTRSAYGLCWRSGSWTPGDALPGCDGALSPPIPNPIAPEVLNNQEEEMQLADAAMAKQCNFSLTLENDQAFALNQAVLNRAAKQRIDQQILPRLAACKMINGITITGHTDMLGSEKYNQILSEKRAASLADYLKANGVQATISVLGVGESQPVKSCSEKMKRAEHIACLAPNRRVSIEVFSAKRNP